MFAPSKIVELTTPLGNWSSIVFKMSAISRTRSRLAAQNFFEILDTKFPEVNSGNFNLIVFVIMNNLFLIVFFVNFFHFLFRDVFDSVFCDCEDVDSVSGCCVSFG